MTDLQMLSNLFRQTWELLGQLQIVDIVDIIIVSVAIYKLIMLTKETRANQVLKGLALVLVASQISQWLNLTALIWIFEYIINNIAIVMVVLFQPELRKALEQMGRSGSQILDKTLHNTKAAPHVADHEAVVDEIVHAAMNMAAGKIGALIVMERSPLPDILSSGTYLYARVSRAILENIFVPNTPLHDGATVISGDTILASGCFLPLTDSHELSKDLGTRHRAAVGMSENSDALVVVVSEETGVVSIAEKGVLTRHVDAAGLKERLNALYEEKAEKSGQKQNILFWRKRHD